MTDSTKFSPRETPAQRKARLLAEVAEIERLEELAAKHGYKMVPVSAAEDTAAPAEHPKKSNDAPAAEGTVASLAERYLTDERSAYTKAKYRTREHYRSCVKRIKEDFGDRLLAKIKAKDIQGLYDGWAATGKAAMSHGCITQLRGLMHFGANVLEDPECERLMVVLHTMRFEPPKRQKAVYMNEGHVDAFIASAHELGLHSMALAQALQFECSLGQKIVIGEWLPISEQGSPSDVIHKDMKWLTGLRWSDINDDLVLSRSDLENEINLKNATRVMAELRRLNPLPKSGPLIVFEKRKRPYHSHQFRRYWRIIADAAGIPPGITNKDSRSAEVPRGHFRQANAR